MMLTGMCRRDQVCEANAVRLQANRDGPAGSAPTVMAMRSAVGRCDVRGCRRFVGRSGGWMIGHDGVMAGGLISAQDLVVAMDYGQFYLHDGHSLEIFDLAQEAIAGV